MLMKPVFELFGELQFARRFNSASVVGRASAWAEIHLRGTHHYGYDYGKMIRALTLLLSLLATTATAADRITWQRLSTTTGDLPVPGVSTQQTGTIIGDFDRDGIADFVITARAAAPAMVWYRRTAKGWSRYVVEDSLLPIEAGGIAADVDGDGDLDIIAGGDYRSNEVWWWENPAPKFRASKPWTRHVIKREGAGQHHDLLAGDFNRDGIADLVFWNQRASALFMATFPHDPRRTESWLYREIFHAEGMAEGLAKADIDGDGFDDIVGGGRWFRRNVDGAFTAHVIDASQQFTRAAAGDLKRGGGPEVVFVSGDRAGRLKWYEGSGDRWTGHDLLGEDVIHGHSLQIADIDGDGNLDIFCAEMGKWTEKAEQPDNPDPRMWIFWGDGKGNFEKTEYHPKQCNHESKIADLDGDGRPDILIKPYNQDAPRVDVWLNRSGRVLKAR